MPASVKDGGTTDRNKKNDTDGTSGREGKRYGEKTTDWFWSARMDPDHRPVLWVYDVSGVYELSA